eukprot:1331887-Prymnesium_polylepis.1
MPWPPYRPSPATPANGAVRTSGGSAAAHRLCPCCPCMPRGTVPCSCARSKQASAAVGDESRWGWYL